MRYPRIIDYQPTEIFPPRELPFDGLPVLLDKIPAMMFGCYVSAIWTIPQNCRTATKASESAAHSSPILKHSATMALEKVPAAGA